MPADSPVRLKRSLDHLPELKQRQLRAITELLCQSVSLEFVILFGSYARGDWVEDEETGYYSDYDLLVVVSEPEVAQYTKLWSYLEGRARQIAARVPVTLLVHGIKEVNKEIRLGQYFFTDIVNEGVALYDPGSSQFARRKVMNDAERLELGRRNMRLWFGSASGFWDGCGYFMARHMPSHAAFLLHQSVERYYHALTLVFTGYKHKTHDIEFLADLGEKLHESLREAMPRVGNPDNERFDLLRRAYIEARYSMTYSISEEDLTWLRECARDLAARVLAVCRERLEQCGGAQAVGELPAVPEYRENEGLPPPPADLSAPRALEDWARGLAEQGRLLGLMEGEARGKELGQKEGEAKLLTALLEHRFGTMPEAVRARLAAADEVALERWGKAVLTAPTLAAVFEELR